MTQSLFGGGTNYKIQTIQDILLDIEKWINLTKKVEEFTMMQYNELINNNYWNTIPYNFQSLIKTSIIYFNIKKQNHCILALF